MFVLMILSVSIYEVIYLILEPYNLGYKYTIYHALPGFIFLKDRFNDYIPLLNFCKGYPFPNVQSHTSTFKTILRWTITQSCFVLSAARQFLLHSKQQFSIPHTYPSLGLCTFVLSTRNLLKMRALFWDNSPMITDFLCAFQGPFQMDPSDLTLQIQDTCSEPCDFLADEWVPEHQLLSCECALQRSYDL